ncbi:Bug family tripartite tricarboxylate transporter substrate binding protein [Achromobacter insolitus]|uniref:Bug family tripartite tricarboxylate transporter substrate binding protein n=1 Tax=Achromobacter insolitus TaxID=217204 RepID=UPI000B51DF99|nr:tripartite tricarboxylate transporter substrate binding protein [Achromobacter insolitus]AXA70975.1 ABC transporter substrate-binding protein [Achromobacter insolitus]MCP1402300.1 tripartite-type tricarboxylate transporter receptor subunit TctC [Achromobacter insolitus]NGT16028.1 tripartite tricarboxylate transporter substrate binding protein [Achromobacter insolitus]OWT59564.1 ABC transporter substrate-binding protein [Achromobacter insolitus]
MNKLMRMLALACAAWLALPAGAARAAYPDKPIRLIVSFPPGSGTDSNARYVAKKMEERLGVAVTVENRPGGNSFIAAQAVAAADPDGYTLLLASNSPVATNAAMFKHLPYDPVKDFAPVARLGYGAMALAVKADAPYKTVADLVNAARQRPGELNFGSGSASYQIATELFLSMGGIKANHVPYRGAAPALTDLAGGQVDFVFADYGAVIPFVQSGRMRLLAVTGDTRLKSAPDTPTLQESGFPGYYMVNWTAAFAPARTPAAIIDTLSDTLVSIYRTPDAAEFLARTNWEVFPVGPKELGAFQREEIRKWDEAAQRAGIPKQ